MGSEVINLGKARHVLHCRGCVTPIVLPRQSRIGTYCSLSYQPKGTWPIRIVCPRIGRAFSYSETDVDLLPVPMMDRTTNLWEIVDGDAQKQNGELKVAYAHTGGRDPRKIALAALGWPDSPAVTLTNLDW